jgi:predicted amidophosphoribosyltransferase
MQCKSCYRAHKACICKIEFQDAKIPLTHVTGYDINRPSVSKSIILGVKDNALDNTFEFLAEEMLTALRERYLRLFERTNVVITYVPRSKRAKRKAGHDQSEQIAKRIALKSGAVFMPLFENNANKKQKTLKRDARQLNALKSYSLLYPELSLSGQTVVIIDDIVTTGASIGACAVLAKKAGAKATLGLSFAKSVRETGIENKENGIGEELC